MVIGTLPLPAGGVWVVPPACVMKPRKVLAAWMDFSMGDCDGWSASSADAFLGDGGGGSGGGERRGGGGGGGGGGGERHGGGGGGGGGSGGGGRGGGGRWRNCCSCFRCSSCVCCPSCFSSAALSVCHCVSRSWSRHSVLDSSALRLVMLGGGRGGVASSGSGGGDVHGGGGDTERAAQHRRKCSLPSSWAHPRLPGREECGQAQFSLKRHLPRFSNGVLACAAGPGLEERLDALECGTRGRGAVVAPRRRCPAPAETSSAKTRVLIIIKVICDFDKFDYGTVEQVATWALLTGSLGKAMIY